MEEHIAATEGVECRKDADVVDETPSAYKDIDKVMEAQKDLVEVVYILKQIVCKRVMVIKMNNMQSTIVVIDGSKGEGGGQMLRSSLSLAMVTGKAFKIANIRVNRKKPGLMRQHLTAVKAAAKICDARVTGAELGSKELIFIPKAKGRSLSFCYRYCRKLTTLVAQTVIPALMLADEPSTLDN